MKVTVELEGLPELLAQFRGVEVGMLDFRTLGTWDWVQSEFYKVEKAQFASEGAAGAGGKWTALNPAYAARKEKKWGPVPILQASGRLYRSMTSANADGVVEKRPLELILGSRVKYGGYHQKGTSRMAKRPPIDFTPEQETQLMKPIQTHLKQIVSQAKLIRLGD